MFLVANKSDLFDEEQVTEEEGKELAQELNAEFILASAKLNLGVPELPKMIIKNYIKTFGIDNSEPKKIVRKSNNSCCGSSSENKNKNDKEINNLSVIL